MRTAGRWATLWLTEAPCPRIPLSAPVSTSASRTKPPLFWERWGLACLMPSHAADQGGGGKGPAVQSAGAQSGNDRGRKGGATRRSRDGRLAGLADREPQ